MDKVINKIVAVLIWLIVFCISTLSALPPDAPTNPTPVSGMTGRCPDRNGHWCYKRYNCYSDMERLEP